MRGRSVPSKPSLLIVGDAVGHTGFATVVHGIADNLSKQWNIHILGINYRGDPHSFNYPIYPSLTGGDMHGVNRLPGLLHTIKPDAVLMVNDPWVVIRYKEAFDLANYDGIKAAYMPVDGLNIQRRFGEGLNWLDVAIAYTEFGKNQFLNAGMTTKLQVIPHGFDRSIFSPVERAVARKVGGLAEDLFIVGSVNRNQPRKRLDLAIEYFAEFAEHKPETVKFLFHGSLNDVGWDIPDLMDYYGVKNRLIVTSPAITSLNGVSKEQMKFIYSTLDVQISTTNGEGWGLCQMEGMACAVPQVFPNWSALGEWAADGGIAIPCYTTEVRPGGINTIGGIADKQAFVQALNLLYVDANYRKEIGIKGYELVNREDYVWKNVANEFSELLTAVINERDSNSKA